MINTSTVPPELFDEQHWIAIAIFCFFLMGKLADTRNRAFDMETIDLVTFPHLVAGAA